MSEPTPEPPPPPPPPEGDGAIPAAIETPRRHRWSAQQAIWLVPLLAVLVVGWLVFQEWLQAGPTVTIHFRSAEGIEAGKTRVKYRDVDIGQVRQVKLAEDRKGVLVVASMVREARPLLVEDTKFWIVRARLSAGEVSGLSTLLSGSYIGIAGGRSEEAAREFTGLEQAPVLTADESGREYRLTAPTLGSLEVGSPIFLRRVRVGQVLGADLEPDGRRIALRIFVRAPYDRLVTANTRFWHDSGIDVSLEASGLRLRTESLQSVIIGGISFETPPDPAPGAASAPPAEAGATFTLFETQAAALRRADWETIDYRATFGESVRGLAAGAPVEFKGFVIGEVAAVDIAFDDELNRFVFPVRMRIYRDLAATVTGAAPRASDPGRRFPMEQLLSARSVERGLRAQLRSANLLTGQRYVAIDFFPEQRGKAVAPRLDAQGRLREIPTAADSFGELQASIARIVKQVEDVPLVELAGDLRRTLAKVETAVTSLDAVLKTTDGTLKSVDANLLPGARATLDEARRAIAEVRALAEQGSPLPAELGSALRDVSRAADALRALADSLERQPESLLRGRRAEPAGQGSGR